MAKKKSSGSNTLKLITTREKEIYAKGNCKWTEAIKKASAELKREKNS